MRDNSLPWVVQKMPNWSTCHLGCRLWLAAVSMFCMWGTLAPPSEYVCVRRWCGLMSSSFDHLLCHRVYICCDAAQIQRDAGRPSVDSEPTTCTVHVTKPWLSRSTLCWLSSLLRSRLQVRHLSVLVTYLLLVPSLQQAVSAAVELMDKRPNNVAPYGSGAYSTLYSFVDFGAIYILFAWLLPVASFFLRFFFLTYLLPCLPFSF